MEGNSVGACLVALILILAILVAGKVMGGTNRAGPNIYSINAMVLRSGE